MKRLRYAIRTSEFVLKGIFQLFENRHAMNTQLFYVKTQLCLSPPKDVLAGKKRMIMIKNIIHLFQID